jgi:hypothetical protein
LRLSNVGKEDPALLGLREQDWCFEGDAEVIMPKILGPIIRSVGEMPKKSIKH